MNNWYGWFIEQLFDDQSIFEDFKGESFQAIDDWGRKHGVNEDQLPEVGLFKLARDSGY